jgi:hypothetical protein
VVIRGSLLLIQRKVDGRGELSLLNSKLKEVRTKRLSPFATLQRRARRGAAACISTLCARPGSHPAFKFRNNAE